MAIINMDGVDGKICSKCEEWKPTADFHKNSARNDDYQSTAKYVATLLSATITKGILIRDVPRIEHILRLTAKKCANISANTGRLVAT
jgi:hypothetical protein